MVGAGYPVDRIVGLDGLLVPRIAEQTFPDERDVRERPHGHRVTGDRVIMQRLGAVPASQDQVSYGAQMYDCAVTIASPRSPLARTTRPRSAPTSRTSPAAGAPARRSPIASSYWPPARTSTTPASPAGYDIDANGDVSTARITTARTLVDGQLVETATDEIDLVAHDELIGRPQGPQGLSRRARTWTFDLRMNKVPQPLFDTQVAAMVCGHGGCLLRIRATKLAKAKIDKSSRFTDWQPPAAQRAADRLCAERRHAPAHGLREAEARARQDRPLRGIAEDMGLVN